MFPSSGLGTPVPQSSALLLAKQSFAEVRSQTEFGNEVDGGSLQTAKQLRNAIIWHTRGASPSRINGPFDSRETLIAGRPGMPQSGRSCRLPTAGGYTDRRHEPAFVPYSREIRHIRRGRLRPVCSALGGHEDCALDAFAFLRIRHVAAALKGPNQSINQCVWADGEVPVKQPCLELPGGPDRQGGTRERPETRCLESGTLIPDDFRFSRCLRRDS